MPNKPRGYSNRKKLMDQAQYKEARAEAKKVLSPEMKAKINAMKERSEAVGSTYSVEFGYPPAAMAIRQQAVKADEHIMAECRRALRSIKFGAGKDKEVKEDAAICEGTT